MSNGASLLSIVLLVRAERRRLNFRDYVKDDGCGGCTTPLDDIHHMQEGIDATGRQIFYSTEANPPIDVISRRPDMCVGKLASTVKPYLLQKICEISAGINSLQLLFTLLGDAGMETRIGLVTILWLTGTAFCQWLTLRATCTSGRTTTVMDAVVFLTICEQLNLCLCLQLRGLLSATYCFVSVPPWQ